jgi:hypothetical protein
MNRLPPHTAAAARADHRAMLRFLAANAFVGVAMGLLVIVLLFWFDTGGIATRVSHASNPLLPVLLIAVPICLTFGGAATASAIMLLPYDRKFSEPPQDE